MARKLNKRRLHLLTKLIRRTKLNADLMRYAANRIKWLRHNKETDTSIPHPTNGMIELGNVCNLHCRICPREYEYGKEMNIGFMPLDKARKILDEMIPYLDSIGLTGLGETMMYPHMLEVLQHIKQRKPSVVTTVSTNAHFTGYLSRVAPLMPYLDCIQFSVDGIGEIYETMRPETDFKVISENIRQTIAMGKDTEFMINCVVTKDNFTEMSSIIDFAHSLGIDFVNFNIMSITSMPQKNFDYYDFTSSEEFRNSLSKAVNEASKHKSMEVTGLEELRTAHNPTRKFHDCLSMWQYPYITWDGFYVPCCGKPFPKELNFGNVFENGVMNTLNSDKAKAFRSLWQKNKPHHFCHNCIR